MRTILGFIFLLAVSLPAFSQKVKSQLNYLVKEPANMSAKTPVLIVLHGYGSNESDLFDLASALDSRFLVFSVRAPNAITGGGFAWYPMEFLADQKFKYDYAKTKQSRGKVLAFISAACAAYKVDSTQVFLMGFSQGAIMSYELALNSPAKIKGVLALSGRMLEESKQLKTNWTAAAKVKFFIAHGNADNVIKIAEAGKATDFLKAKKAVVTYKTYACAHTISGEELSDIRTWLAGAIDPKADPKKKVL